MNAMDTSLKFMFWFGMVGGGVMFVYTISLWLLTRHNEEDDGASPSTGATAPLLLPD